MNHLDLFSGLGGFALAARWCGIETVGFCEIDPYAQAILKKNFGAVMADDSVRVRPCISGNSENAVPIMRTDSGCSGDIPEIKEAAANSKGQQTPQQGQTGFQSKSTQRRPRIHPDIFTLDGTQYRGVSIVTGGFPCQPFSCAGKRRGKEDDRHLWSQMCRVISEARPAWVIGENVPGIIGMELDSVLSDLEGIGYACRTFVIPACAVDARHRRDRVWIVANATGTQQMGTGCGDDRTRRQAQRSSCGGETMANPISPRLEIGQEQPARKEREAIERGGDAVSDTGFRRCSGPRTGECGESESDGRQPQPRLRGVADGLPSGMDGGAWVWPDENPEVPRIATGIPNRVHRLRCLGNAIVPQVAYQLMQFILEAEKQCAH